MKLTHFIVLIAVSAICLKADNLSPSSTSSLERATMEGWHWVGIPVEDWVPYHLELDAKEIAGFEEKYVVVFGYLVASTQSIVLFPNEEASRANRTEQALILSRENSPALRWLAPNEGYYAVGGMYRSGSKAFLGHLSFIRFAIKKESDQPAPVLNVQGATPHTKE